MTTSKETWRMSKTYKNKYVLGRRLLWCSFTVLGGSQRVVSSWCVQASWWNTLESLTFSKEVYGTLKISNTSDFHRRPCQDCRVFWTFRMPSLRVSLTPMSSTMTYEDFGVLWDFPINLQKDSYDYSLLNKKILISAALDAPNASIEIVMDSDWFNPVSC